MRFLAIKKYRDGGEQTMEYFSTKKECLVWILMQGYYLYTKTPKELWDMGKMISIKVRAFNSLTDSTEIE